MSEPMGLTEFFAMEAGDYLERLDALVSRGDEPNREEFLRLTRALRGSALMANQQPFAQAAASLERLARAVRDGSRAWDAATKQVTIRAVDDLKILIRKVRYWGEDDTHKAQQTAQAVQEVLGAGRTLHPSGRGGEVGTRAFIAQQGAALATALDQAARTLQQNPMAHDPLQATLRMMRPLRGIASLVDHPPLPDLLDGIERAVAELTRRTSPSAEAAAIFSAAATAVSRAASEIAAKGKASPDTPAARDFSRRLSTLLGWDAETVPIEDLYYDDAGPHVVREGAAPSRPGKLGNLELVSHGEHLRQAADALERAEAIVQRELRAHALVGTFRALESHASGTLGQSLAELARQAREAIIRGAPTHDVAGFAKEIREAGTILSTAAQTAEAELAERVAVVAVRLRDIMATPREPPVPLRPELPAAPRRPPAPSAGITQPQPPEPVPAPAAAGPESGEESADLAGGYARYEHLAAAMGMGPPSLDELLAGAPGTPPPQRTVTAARPALGPIGRAAPVAPETALGADAVPISQLCYEGPAALQRALSLRDRVRDALRTPDADSQSVRDLLEEIFDLVELGIGRGR